MKLHKDPTLADSICDLRTRKTKTNMKTIETPNNNMNRIIFLVITLSVAIVSCSEKEVNQKTIVDRNGIAYEVNNEEPYTGKVFNNYDNQQLKIIGYYISGLKTGTWEYFESNGQKSKIEIYLDGLLNGNSKEYNDKNILVKDALFSNGKLEGIYKTFYPDGGKEYDGVYKADKKEGKWLEYYDNKIVKSEKHYHEDNQVDKSKEWNELGQLIFEGNYPGIHIWYKADEEKGATMEFKDGKYLKRTLRFWFNKKEINPYVIENINWKYHEKHHGSHSGRYARPGYTKSYYYYFASNGKLFFNEKKNNDEIRGETYSRKGKWWINFKKLPKSLRFK